MRKEELLGLKWRDIDFENRQFEVANTVIYVNGFGIKENSNKTKNASSNRIVKIGNSVIDILLEYKEWCKDMLEQKDIPFTDDKNLFINSDGKLIFPQTINHWLDKTLKKCGLEHHTVHSLRHSYTSLMLEQAPLLVVSKRIGHSRPSTTTDVYGHVVTDTDIALAKTENYLSASNNEKKERLISALDLLVY